MRGCYSLFNLERILLANFLMSAIRSSSSALVSEGRREQRRGKEINGEKLILCHPLTDTCVPADFRDRINTESEEMVL